MVAVLSNATDGFDVDQKGGNALIDDLSLRSDSVFHGPHIPPSTATTGPRRPLFAKPTITARYGDDSSTQFESTGFTFQSNSTAMQREAGDRGRPTATAEEDSYRSAGASWASNAESSYSSTTDDGDDVTNSGYTRPSALPAQLQSRHTPLAFNRANLADESSVSSQSSDGSSAAAPVRSPPAKAPAVTPSRLSTATSTLANSGGIPSSGKVLANSLQSVTTGTCSHWWS